MSAEEEQHNGSPPYTQGDDIQMMMKSKGKKRKLESDSMLINIDENVAWLVRRSKEDELKNEAMLKGFQEAFQPLMENPNPTPEQAQEMLKRMCEMLKKMQEPNICEKLKGERIDDEVKELKEDPESLC